MERGALVLYERPLTSEIGMWALLRRPNLGPPSLLAVGEWGFHEAAFRVGNRPLSPKRRRASPSASAGPVRRWSRPWVAASRRPRPRSRRPAARR